MYQITETEANEDLARVFYANLAKSQSVFNVHFSYRIRWLPVAHVDVLVWPNHSSPDTICKLQVFWL